MKSPASLMALNSLKSSEHSHRNAHRQYQKPHSQDLLSGSSQALGHIYKRGIQEGLWVAVLTFIIIVAW